MNPSNKRFIVTGAAGFIGSHLCQVLLENDNQVVGVDCFTDYYNPDIKKRNIREFVDDDRFELISKNLLDLDYGRLLPTVDGIFHQAAQAGVRSSWGQEFDEYIDQNIRSTQRLLEAIKEYDPELPCIMASSSSIYGIPRELPMRVGMAPQPYSPYGVTKLASEHLGMLYHENFGLRTAALRYFTVFGPRQRPDMAFTRFLGWIHEDISITIFGDGSQSRDFTYVLDVVEANLEVLRREKFGDVYNVGGGQRATLNEVIQTMEEVIGKPVNREYGEKQVGDVPHTDADTSRIRNQTNWSPEFSLEQGLELQWEWIRQNELVLETIRKAREQPRA